ncbi:MAG: glutathione S-transferase family protein [Rhodospirillaceae bacterium]|jgi:glutathione S-transferase|nr:glutathione S-transferase family protein [Rhodospirillaceae bacterium]MBT4046279.1 glutathione S-transferase family protein [Rhodospirillaceae bacterium]MBT4687420.1 glutathione S-transferase family protein [Rhodospirillaceae bacterium]MBT5079680.1 glutathione S-transferase family protein [Rhodospirillaceae bacterium]MBT5527179.1 glutathione S-transferase family protein [Rhodospirillaceae bacterium]
MICYDLPASPNARRVRIFIAEKGLEIPTVAVDMAKGENKTAEYLAKNSLGKMPLLELDDGTFISESHAICRYLEEIHPEPPLMGTSPVERAQVEMWNRRIELEILLPLLNVFIHTHEMWKGVHTQIPEWGDICREKTLTSLAWLDGEIAGRDYIANDTYTIADITAQCAIVMGKAVGIRVPEELENVSAWFARVAARPTARA